MTWTTAAPQMLRLAPDLTRPGLRATIRALPLNDALISDKTKFLGTLHCLRHRSQVTGHRWRHYATCDVRHATNCKGEMSCQKPCLRSHVMTETEAESWITMFQGVR